MFCEAQRATAAAARWKSALVALLLAWPTVATAWIYPEHRDILAVALNELPPELQAVAAKLWLEARTGNEARYCQTMVSGDGRTAPECLDLAAWAAIAGDHSCSPDQLLTKTLPSPWILKVAAVGAQTKTGLEKAKTRDATLNEWAISNLKLQFVDPEYASRAGANNGHFLIPRTSNNLTEYLAAALGPDAEPNALGLYLYYHLAAVGLAHQWASLTDAAARAELARRVLATEAFAVHFLEDVFAAGHVAGTWGGVAERKGTHDYYSEYGLDTSAWDGTLFVIRGDAHMTDKDLARTAAMVGLSLSQVLEAARGSPKSRDSVAKVSPDVYKEASAFDSCTATRQAAATVTPETLPLAKPLAEKTPLPGRPETDVHVPHFRQEIGPFVGFAGDLTGGLEFGGFQSGTAAPRAYAGAEVEFRIGVGLEALTGSTGAGQLFLGVGLSYGTPQQGGEDSEFAAAGVPVVPARRGVTFRLRVPFYIIPFDLLLVAPVLSWASPSAMTNMAIVAGSGGLLPWQRAFNTPIGAFQFLLGREVAVTLNGYFGDRVENVGLAAPGATVPYASNLVFLSYRILGFDFPTVEYRPLREFSTNQALTFAIQLGWGVEFPNQVQYVPKLTLPAATGPTPQLAPGWMLYLRIHFDARYYF
jgi:hypothetical protein